jgi:hypothetical protein
MSEPINPVESPANAEVKKVLTGPEVRVRSFAKVFAIAQVMVTSVLVVIGDFGVRGADLFGSSFLKMNNPKVEVDSSHFWKALSVSLMVSLAYFGYQVWRDPRINLDWLHPIAVIAGTGALSFLLFFLHYYTFSLVIGFIVLALVAMVVLFLWWRAKAAYPPR